MLFYIIVCNVLFIHLKVFTTVAITIKTDLNIEPHEDYNKTKVTVVSEGGLITNTPIQLPKENQTVLLSLDKEIGNYKRQSVIPRKGVVFNNTESFNTIRNVTYEKSNILSTVNISNIENVNETVPSVEPKIVNHLPKKMHMEIESKTEKPKKPLILSSEDLENMDESSSYDASVLKPHILKSSGTKHPGMIMPIVITILVVPMFAVIGYFALRRGQEAWKNRHYKRMDFLLDGMYND